MKRVPFGRMNWDVSPMGLGTFFLRLESRARGERIEAIRRALELGINYLDTAPVYGLGEVERFGQQAVWNRPDIIERPVVANVHRGLLQRRPLVTDSG